MHDDRLSIRLDADLQRDIESLARETGQSESNIVRQALRHHVRAKRQSGTESAYDVAKRLGVVGAVTRLPRDLSTHRKHMQGFGQ